ncbi:MAG: NUDIX domain-containing protein [Phycisphaera sp.]|nr:NUDIX domain-containing protein [Phycisphaera sp.]
MSDLIEAGPVEVAIAAILDHDLQRPDREPRILAAWRSRNAIRGGVWELPGGKIERNETAAQAAIRETREELGIDIEILASIATNEDVDEEQPREKHVRVQLLLARTLDGDPTISDRPWKWIPLGELAEHPWPRANIGLNGALATFLGAPRS